MKRTISTAVALAVAVVLLTPAPSSALDLKFRVSNNSPFIVNATLFGNLQIVLNAAWSKANADLDMALICEDDLFLASISTEPKNEMASVGFFGGNSGTQCEIVVASFRGASKGNLTVLFTGAESAASGVEFVGASYRERPQVTEAIRLLRERKRALASR